MGFLDNLLNAVESGDLERQLDRISGAVENVSKRVDDTLQTAAEQPAKVLESAERVTRPIEEATGGITPATAEGVEN